MFENTKKSTNKYVSYSIHNLYTLLLVSIQQNSQKLQTKFSNLPNKILKTIRIKVRQYRFPDDLYGVIPQTQRRLSAAV